MGPWVVAAVALAIAVYFFFAHSAAAEKLAALEKQSGSGSGSGSSAPSSSPSLIAPPAERSAAAVARSGKKDEEKQKKAREAAEQLEKRTAELAELKEKLKEAKKKLHDERETVRPEEIAKAVVKAEKEALAKAEQAEKDASDSKLEVARLAAELEAAKAAAKKGFRAERPVEAPVAAPAPAPAPVVAAAPAAPAAPAPSLKTREPTTVEEIRMAELERLATKAGERARAAEKLAEERLQALESQQKRGDNVQKVNMVSKAELESFRARLNQSEKRLARAMLENDRLRVLVFKTGRVEEMEQARNEAAAEVEAGKAPTAEQLAVLDGPQYDRINRGPRKGPRHEKHDKKAADAAAPGAAAAPVAEAAPAVAAEAPKPAEAAPVAEAKAPESGATPA